MKIVIASPLYPPDIADPAPYVKELARRLSGEHTVVVVTYGRLPEEVPGVQIMTTDKRQPALFRIIGFTVSLFRALRSADILYVQSGVSAELPALTALSWYRPKVLLRITNGAEGLVRHTVRHIMLRHATRISTVAALVRPEILPFAPRPEAALRAYGSAWETHLHLITA